MLPRGIWPIEGAFALAAVEACQMSACQRCPEDTVAVDVPPTRPIPREWWLEHFSQRSRRWIWARVKPNDVPGEALHCAPNGPVDWAHRNSIISRCHALVFGRIDRLVGLDIFVPLTVAVGVEDERRPPLGFHLVAGLLVHLAVQPA